MFKVSDYGAHVQLPNGMPALVHISQWAHHRVRDIHEVASEGMEVDVLCKVRPGAWSTRHLAMLSSRGAEKAGGQPLTQGPSPRRPSPVVAQTAQ